MIPTPASNFFGWDITECLKMYRKTKNETHNNYALTFW